MADAITINDTQYAGEVETEFFLTRAVVDMDTYAQGCLVVKDGIKKQHTIDRIEVSNFIQDRAATPTSQGSVVIDYKQLVPANFMAYMEFNPRDFEDTWWSKELADALLNRQLPQTVENFLILQLMKRLNQYNEYAIWQSRVEYNPAGDNVATPAALVTATNNNNFYYYDGFIKKALDATDTIVVPSPAALTYSNIRAKMQLALNLIPIALLNRFGTNGVKFMMSKIDWFKYDQALREDTYKNQDTTQTSNMRFAGYDIVPVAGLPENTFFVLIATPDAQSGNLWMGINSKDDAKVELRQLQANSELYFVKGLFKADVNFGFTDQVVMYTMES